MGLILGDAAIGLAWATIKPLGPWTQHRLGVWRRKRLETAGAQANSERVPLLSEEATPPSPGDEDEAIVDDGWPASSLVTPTLMLGTSITLFCLYWSLLYGSFKQQLPPMATLAAIALVPVAGIISMRSLGETDNGSVIAISRSQSLGSRLKEGIRRH